MSVRGVDIPSRRVPRIAAASPVRTASKGPVSESRHHNLAAAVAENEVAWGSWGCQRDVTRGGRCRGLALLAVMVIIAATALVAAGLLFRMRSEVTAAAATGRQHQAHAAAMSGIHLALAVLRDPPDAQELWHDNPALFQNVELSQAADQRWYFTVWAPLDDNPDQVRFGLIDEAGKLNVNTADADTLAGLPGMDTARVDALLDYRDGDDDPRPQGAEQDYYAGLSPAYRIKNGRLASVEELLLVRGFDGPAVFGEDANGSGLLEASEDDGDESFPPDDADGVLDRGLQAWLTARSWVYDTDADGAPRAAIASGTDFAALDLPDEAVRYLEIVLDQAPADEQPTHPAELLQARFTLIDDTGPPHNLTAGDEIASGITVDNVDQVLRVLSHAGTGDATQGEVGGRLIGRLNVLSAPVAVLAALPELDEAVAQGIVDERVSLGPDEARDLSWLVRRGVVPVEAFRAAAPRLTTRSHHFRVRSMGFEAERGTFCVMEAVIELDEQRGNPRIVYLRDRSRHGRPLPIDVEQQAF